MAVDSRSKTLRDWLVCCDAETNAFLLFLAGGCSNVEDVRKLTEGEFKKLGVSSGYGGLFNYEVVRLLHHRTRTGEDLCRELIVSIL